MLEDDHYISNSRNAHIDTSEFERDVREQLTPLKCEDRIEEALDSIYNLAFSTLSVPPREPGENTLICRYLSAARFLQFLQNRCIYFPAATQFSDHWECRVPEDYENVVLKILAELDMSAESWSSLIKRKAACWNVSCWTQLDEHFDDHLMWSLYAGGPEGVGVTVRYGVLKNILAKSVTPFASDSVLHSGAVNYETLSLLPFNKHYMFRKEREIRFAFATTCGGARSIPVGDIFECFGIRICPAATVEHRDMMRRLWINFGGVDRVQWPQ
jgi:hypothetical protein